MTTFSIQSTPGSLYKWSASSFAWGSISGESLSWAGSHPSSIDIFVEETIETSTSSPRAVSVSRAESFAMNDQQSNLIAFARNFQESLGFAETYVDLIGFYLNVLESLNLVETDGRHAARDFSETFAIAGQSSRQIKPNFVESLNISETFNRSVEYLRAILETINLAEKVSKSSEINKSEVFGAVESGFQNTIGLGVTEFIAVVEGMIRGIDFTREFAESLELSETARRHYSFHKAESLSMVEAYVRNANAVISDILIESGDLTEAEFAAMVNSASPPGYSSFNRFISGDYEYQRAIFKTVLKSLNDYRPSISGLEVEVDVPDVFDRGVSAINNTGTINIVFTRPFNVPPEVTATIKSGLVWAIPRVTAVSTTQFTVELRDSNDNPASGTISWGAHGY
jgi:hypothetical protein